MNKCKIKENFEKALNAIDTLDTIDRFLRWVKEDQWCPFGSQFNYKYIGIGDVSKIIEEKEMISVEIELAQGFTECNPIFYWVFDGCYLKIYDWVSFIRLFIKDDWLCGDTDKMISAMRVIKEEIQDDAIEFFNLMGFIEYCHEHDLDGGPRKIINKYNFSVCETERLAKKYGLYDEDRACNDAWYHLHTLWPKMEKFFLKKVWE